MGYSFTVTAKVTALAVLLVVAVMSQPKPAGALHVLGIFPMGAHSHNIMFKSMMEALVAHGHSVVMLSPFPQKTPIANYTDLDVSDRLPPMLSTLEYETVVRGHFWNAWNLLNMMAAHCGSEVCRAVFSSQHFRDVMNGKHGKFDVLLTETHGTDCFTAVSYKLGIPLIGLVPLPDMPYMHDRLGTVINPSYMPNIYEPFGAKMNFWERARNTLSVLTFQVLQKRWMVDGSDSVVREFLGEDMPPLADIIRNTSLVLVNRHHASEWARPQTPNNVNVGALHVKRAWKGQRNKPVDLAPTFQKWVDDADENGVIVFTIGSLLKVSTFPEEIQDGIFEVLGNLPQRVIFKYEGDRANLPANVLVAPWIPQGELLAHPKVVLFITHCGLMGTQEAVIAGVPLVCIPMFADQYHNAALYQHLGTATVVGHSDFRKQTLDTAVRKVLFDSSYRRRAQELSRRYLDRPLAVDEEAVYWVEYVARYGGAQHLRPQSADLSLYQYLLLDVLAAAVAVLAFAALLVASLTRWLLARITGRKAGSPTSPSHTAARGKKQR